MHTGENIRKFRMERGVAAERLAAVLDREPAYLEEVEACRVEPSVPELLRIARALQTDLSALIYGMESSAKKALITRRKERVQVQRVRSYDYESLAPYFVGRHLEPFEVVVKPDLGENHEPSSHQGEEFLYVLEGMLKLVIDGSIYVLERGDSIFFDSALSHELYGVDGPARVLAVLYNGEGMAHLTRSRRMRELIEGARRSTQKQLALVCPDAVSLAAARIALDEGVIERVWLFGLGEDRPRDLASRPERYRVVPLEGAGEDLPARAAAAAVAAVREGSCDLLMKGELNTTIFLKAVLNKSGGIGMGRRLSMVSLFELPALDRLILLTDPAINPFLTHDGDLETSKDIIVNAIEVARSLGVEHPRVAILDANEMPSEAVPTTLNAQRLSRMPWTGAEVYGPLSYDLALYQDAVEHKGIKDNPVAGRADILVVPYVSSGNFLYKAWAMTLGAEVANVVVGAQVPLIITSRADSDMTKFLTLCASVVYGQHLKTLGQAAG